MAKNRTYDIVVFGATGFTGGLTADYLAAHVPPTARWAIAGRSKAKLEAVKARLVGLNPACVKLDLLEVDATDSPALLKLAKSARVVITTVGPYILHGEPLVAACAEAGTDYVDLTGEPEFVDLMWLKYHQVAKRSGARLVHSCGFDSIPHDLGAYFTVLQLPEDVPLKINGYVRASGEISGGTYQSAVTAFGRLRSYAKIARERRALDGWPIDRKIGSTRGRISFNSKLGSWVVPFPTIDPQVVRRSAAALERYGPDFRYGHFVQLKSATQVAALVGGASALMMASQIKPARDWLLSKKAAGDGPDAARREKSWFRVRFHGCGGTQRVVVDVTGGDPGYGETSKMLAESAMCLAFDKLPKRAGQLTPVVAMGDALIPRLQRAGIGFKVVPNA